MYEYSATVLRVVDGDTVHMSVDLGMEFYALKIIRLYGINAPEMSTPEGLAARQYLLGLLGHPRAHDLPKPVPVVVTTVKDRTEKYGRYLATIFRNAKNLNQAMIDGGHAVEYLP